MRGSGPVDEKQSPPPDQATGIARQIIASGYSGPLPAPSDLREFDAIVPNGAERIFRQWEIESQHQREAEKVSIVARNDLDRLGRILGFPFSMAALATTVLLAWLGHPTVAGVIGGATMVSVALALIVGRKQRAEP